jgi:hypothetical protein
MADGDEMDVDEMDFPSFVSHTQTQMNVMQRDLVRTTGAYHAMVTEYEASHEEFNAIADSRDQLQELLVERTRRMEETSIMLQQMSETSQAAEARHQAQMQAVEAQHHAAIQEVREEDRLQLSASTLAAAAETERLNGMLEVARVRECASAAALRQGVVFLGQMQKTVRTPDQLEAYMREIDANVQRHEALKAERLKRLGR